MDAEVGVFSFSKAKGCNKSALGIETTQGSLAHSSLTEYCQDKDTNIGLYSF